MAPLFDNEDPDATAGFKHIQTADAASIPGKIREELEKQWQRYEPYADKEFASEFGRHPEERFRTLFLSPAVNVSFNCSLGGPKELSGCCEFARLNALGDVGEDVFGEELRFRGSEDDCWTRGGKVSERSSAVLCSTLKHSDWSAGEVHPNASARRSSKMRSVLGSGGPQQKDRSEEY